MNRTLGIILLLLLCAGVAAAQVDGKNTIVNVGSHLIRWEVGDEKTDFEGYAIGGTIAMSPSMAIRGAFFATENEETDDVKINGLEAQLLLGSNLNGMGFKLYGMGGFFKDTMEVEMFGQTVDEDYTGLMLGGGLGYNWSGLALDFSLAWRDEGDYTDGGDESKSDSEPDVTMLQGTLSVGLRF